MKQGRASSSGPASQKVEPTSKAVNVRKVANIGLQQIMTRPLKDAGRGYKAPMAKSSTHPRGTQGKH